ncbi:MAG: hypothetical protein LBD20_07675 [Spirochaetaceae bacterium]|jgi:hypothetical protein|nr:hypothetical protein [Spirochaetaceae bacterium]
MTKHHLSKLIIARLVSAVGALFFMASCIGVKLNITAGKNGGGDMELEYRLKKELVELASFGDDDDEPPVPLTRQDFENSIAGINGISLKSYTHKKDDFDYSYKVKMNFASFDALAAFLSKTTDGSASYTQRGGKNEFTYFFWSGAGGGNGTAEMFRGAFDGYGFDFSIRLPSSCEAYYVNANGEKLAAPPSGAAELKGTTFVISAGMADLLLAGSPAAFVLTW